MAAALDHVYRYSIPSALLATEQGDRLRLATSGGAEAHPFLFRGTLTDARTTADLLLAVSRVVQSRFHLPPAMLARILREADPVITCGQERIRFEGFSACCGAYARLDLLPGAVDGSLLACGTTNVDFNPPMRAALARVGEGERVGLAVGTEAVELEREAGDVVEKRVPLPLRWIKGFCEVQGVQATMKPRLEVSGAEARRFLRSLPRGGTSGRPAWIAGGSSTLRLSQVASRGAIRVAGTERLRVLEEIVRHARGLRIHASDSNECTGWELLLPHARFHLVLSPEVWRGFSGEGGLLHALAAGPEETDGAESQRVQEALGWGPRIDTAAVAADSGLREHEVRQLLAQLSGGGRVGYDLAEGGYFRRELPFDLTTVETLQPRLRDARKLVAEGGVRLEAGSDKLQAWVRGTGVEHHVRLEAEGARCTCPWFGRHRGERGPCKHILAVQLTVDPAQEGRGAA